MKATINISIEVNDLGDLDRVERAVHALAADLAGYGKDVLPPSGPPPSDGKKKSGGKKGKPVAIEPEPSQDDVENGVSEDDLKAAVRAKIESDGVDTVKEIFAKFKANKLSDLKPSQYPKVLEALEA